MKCDECEKQEIRWFTWGNGFTTPIPWCLELDRNCTEAIYKCKALTNG